MHASTHLVSSCHWNRDAMLHIKYLKSHFTMTMQYLTNYFCLHSVFYVQQFTTLINITTICTIPVGLYCHFVLVDGCESSGVSVELRIISIK